MNKWISARERLPEIGKRVLVCGEKGGVFICKRDSMEDSFGRMDGTSKYRGFTYWMPLPEPPRENGNMLFASLEEAIDNA